MSFLHRFGSTLSPIGTFIAACTMRCSRPSLMQTNGPGSGRPSGFQP